VHSSTPVYRCDGGGWLPNANSVLTIFKILDQDDYWLAVQKPGDGPSIFLFSYRDESPKWDILPVIRTSPRVSVRSHVMVRIFSAGAICRSSLRKQMETGKSVKIRLSGAKRLFTLHPADNESDFLRFALRHCPNFLRAFSGSCGAKAKLEFIA
jgi:hypothetical protein